MVVHLVVAKSDANCFGILGKVASPVPAGGSAQLGCTICLRLVPSRGAWWRAAVPRNRWNWTVLVLGHR